MPQYEEQLLKALVEKYRKSKKDDGSNLISRRTQLAPNRLYKKYNDNDADLAKVDAVNAAVESLTQKGWLTCEKTPFSSEISKIYLVDACVGAIENYLAEHYGYQPRDAALENLRRLLDAYDGKTRALTAECAKLKESLARRAVPKDLARLEDIFKALLFVERNERQLYLREASMLIYGGSKYFEENSLEAVATILRRYYDQPCAEEELNDEILQRFAIYKEQPRLCLKGAIVLTIAGREVDVGLFANGIEFAAEESARIEKVKLADGALTTVENKTSYQRLQADNAAYFYLGGFMSRGQRDFLKKIYRDNPHARYYHFGDIDAGGLFIYEHLRRATGVPFAMYKMSAAELADARNQSCLLPLTQHDRERLASLRENKELRGLVDYMLEHNVKLEQEIVSLGQLTREV